MKSPSGSGRSSWLYVAAAVLIAYSGCSRTKTGSSSASEIPTPADSAAFSQAIATKEESSKLSALQAFVLAHPRSPLSGNAYPAIVALAGKLSPETVPGILKAFQKTDYASANPYNQVGWELAEAGKNLDQAVPILVKAVAKARAAGDSTNLASCLDSEAWARYKAGDAKAAVAPMEEAKRLFKTSDDEIERHMALIYDAAQMPEKAQPLYVALLSHMEDPDIRDRLAHVVSSTGGSMEEIDSKIDAARAASTSPCPAFSLPNLSGGAPVSLADFRGKVVLLNFWHYT